MERKLDGEAQVHARKLAFKAAIATLALLGAVSLYTPFLDATYFERWFSMPSFLFAGQVPLLTAIVAFALFRALNKRQDAAPFVLSLFIFLLGMAGLGISMWPYVVPDTISIWYAAAQPSVHAGSGSAHVAIDPWLHCLDLLGRPGESRTRGISLMPGSSQPPWKRLAWMVAIWSTSVTVLGAVAWTIRQWLAP